LVDTVIAEFGRVDILVNNAGSTPHGNLLERSDDDWLAAYDAKIHNFVRMCRATWPHLQRTRGQIINIGGVLAHSPNPQALIGSTLAAAVVNLTKALAEYGRADGIRVNGVNPGLIDTGRFRQRLEELAAQQNLPIEEARKRMIARLGIDRFGTAEDVAEMVALLVSGQLAYVQGAIIDVDGGMTKSL